MSIKSLRNFPCHIQINRDMTNDECEEILQSISSNFIFHFFLLEDFTGRTNNLSHHSISNEQRYNWYKFKRSSAADAEREFSSFRAVMLYVSSRKNYLISCCIIGLQKVITAISKMRKFWLKQNLSSSLRALNRKKIRKRERERERKMHTRMRDISIFRRIWANSWNIISKFRRAHCLFAEERLSRTMDCYNNILPCRAFPRNSRKRQSGLD